jgi:light-regulated signal transduction histidine kinase (bacteriophytochrome)
MEKKLRDSEEKYRHQLEKLVAARTAELEAANDTLRSEIAERRRAEDRLARQAQELARSNAELEQFAYVVSHDLREPLRKIKSYAELLEQRFKGQIDARADKYIACIVDGTIRMQTRITDLLTYSRVGRGELVLVPTSLEGVLSQVLADLETYIRESEAVVTHGSLPTVAVDPLQVAQLLQNLVSNAIKFRGPDGLRVHVSAEQRNGEWIVAVQDNGIGIDPQHSERIFQVFQRLHTASEYPGTGIGLAICKRIVERHNGHIWVESQLGQGAKFCFSIPAG